MRTRTKKTVAVYFGGVNFFIVLLGKVAYIAIYNNKNGNTKAQRSGQTYGRSYAIVTVNVQRGHLVSLDTGEIDTDDPTNQAWILKYLPASEYILPVTKNKPAKPTPVVLEKKQQGQDKFDLDLAKKKADIEKVHGEIRLQKLKEAKLRGEMVPIDLMRTTLEVHTRSIVTAMKDGMEDLLLQVSSEFRGSSEQLSRLRGIVITILNAQVDKSVEATKKQLRVLANDYAERKEVGEHE